MNHAFVVEAALAFPHVSIVSVRKLDLFGGAVENCRMEINGNAALRAPQSPKDGRTEARTVLRVSATVLFKNAPPMPGKTIDISPSGLALLGEEQLIPGTECGVRFTAMVQGKIMKVEAVARVVYSICVGITGFRTGFQFTNMDPASKTAITQIIASQPR
ncbi:MAG TPA: PilZ domain-containing protein [Paucimonas sp.]|nr:PilZ domain-containing protein [Paucimonas sp.]